MNLFLAMILGLGFGAVLVSIGASNYKVILSMLRLQNLNLMKTILLGIGIAGVLLNISVLLGFVPDSHIAVKPMNLGVLVGAVIFGFGFGFGGTCPGTCVAGSSHFYALSAVLGGLAGAIIFSYAYPLLENLSLFQNVWGGKITLFRLSNEVDSIFSSQIGGILVSLAMIGMAIILPDELLKEN